MGEITLPDGRVIYNVPDSQTPGAVPPKNPTQPRTMGDVGTEATLNAMPSAKQYARDAANAVMHPVQSLEAVRDITQGGLRRFYGENAPAWLPQATLGRSMPPRNTLRIASAPGRTSRTRWRPIRLASRPICRCR